MVAEPHGIGSEVARSVRVIRRHALVATGGMLVLAMALAAGLLLRDKPSIDWTAAGVMFILAFTLPIPMSALAQRIVLPATELATAHEQTLEAYNRARLDALLDPITGLGNHRAFQEELDRQIADATRRGEPLGLVMIDLDDLKTVNDERGHAKGDELLGSMGRLIRRACRVADRGFRVGGDEFAILLPGADIGQAHAIAQRMLAMALEPDATTTLAFEPFSFSAGVSSFPEPSSDGRRLIAQADAALYWAKRHGRTDVQAYDPDRHGSVDDPRTTAELGEAVVEIARTRALVAVYQPIYDLTSGQPIGYEGLIRPADGAGFRDAPALFAAAEAADRTVELDAVCFAVVCEGAHFAREDQYLAINISPRTIETEQFHVGDLVAVLSSAGIAPQRVVLEITERESIGDMARLRQNLEACRAAGLRIAADDVGAGNAGLRLLSEIRFDIVKIDLSLVQGGALRASATSVIHALHAMTDRAGAVLVAEGIETGEQLEVVRGLGLGAGQGYLLAMPGPATDAEPIDIDELIHRDELRRTMLLGAVA